jgi:hypothetical protein
MISLSEAERLFALSRSVKSGCIVEVGSYRGRSSVALAMGSQAGCGVPVYAVEPHESFRGILGGSFGAEDRGAFYSAMLRTGCYQFVRLINLSSEQVTPGWTQAVGLLFLDGDHTTEGVRRDWRCWEPHLRPDAAVAFDDATDPELGPYGLLAELIAGGWHELEGAGKLRVIQR